MKHKFPILISCAILSCAAILCSNPAKAQQPVTPKIYGLTNSATFCVANGSTNIATTVTARINSQPFPIWRGRGFMFNTSLVGTNSGTATVAFSIEYGAVQGGVTNWSTYGSTGISIPMNGTTVVYACSNIPPTTVDNITLGRLGTILNNHTATVKVDPTNTYVTVIP